MKKVSIIIPAYNTEKYISECLDSALNQTYENIEIIVVEDKSTDNTLNIIKQYQSRYPQLIVLKNDINKGLSYTRNRALTVATGDYISFLDSDDIMEPLMIEKLVKALEDNNVSVSVCRFKQFIGKLSLSRNNTTGRVNVIDLNQDNNYLYNISGVCWNKLFKRDLATKLSFPNKLIYEDNPFTYPLLAVAREIAFVDEILYKYRRNINGITISNKRHPKKEILDVYKSVNILDYNYNLIKIDNTFDVVMNNIEHAMNLIMALTAAEWLTVLLSVKKEIVSYIVYMSNQKYGFNHISDNCFISDRMNVSKIYSLRIKFLECLSNYSICKEYTEKEILDKIETLIDSYGQNKCKTKRK